MAAGDIRDRLVALPGVVDCNLTDDAIVMVAAAGTDLRLVRARAEVVCIGDPRPVSVSAAPAMVPAGAGVFGRRPLRGVETPTAVAAASVLALALIAFLPGADDPGRAGGPAPVELASGSVTVPPDRVVADRVPAPAQPVTAARPAFGNAVPPGLGVAVGSVSAASRASRGGVAAGSTAKAPATAPEAAAVPDNALPPEYAAHRDGRTEAPVSRPPVAESAAARPPGPSGRAAPPPAAAAGGPDGPGPADHSGGQGPVRGRDVRAQLPGGPKRGDPGERAGRP